MGGEEGEGQSAQELPSQQATRLDYVLIANFALRLVSKLLCLC